MSKSGLGLSRPQQAENDTPDEDDYMNMVFSVPSTKPSTKESSLQRRNRLKKEVSADLLALTTPHDCTPRCTNHPTG